MRFSSSIRHRRFTAALCRNATVLRDANHARMINSGRDCDPRRKYDAYSQLRGHLMRGRSSRFTERKISPRAEILQRFFSGILANLIFAINLSFAITVRRCRDSLSLNPVIPASFSKWHAKLLIRYGPLRTSASTRSLNSADACVFVYIYIYL